MLIFFNIFYKSENKISGMNLDTLLDNVFICIILLIT